MRKSSERGWARTPRLDLPQRDPVYSNPLVTLFLSLIFSDSTYLKAPPPVDSHPLSPHSSLPKSEFPYSRRVFSPFPLPPQPRRVPSTLHARFDSHLGALRAAGPPRYRAHAFSVPLLSTGAQMRKSDREAPTPRGRGGRKMEREGERWGWLSSVLRDAHQSTQSHGRATATVSVKGILFRQWSRDYFLQVPRVVSPPAVSPLFPFPRAGTVRSAVPQVFQRGSPK